MSDDPYEVVRRMVSTADGYLRAAETLKGIIDDFGFGPGLLDILGFEILLKAVYRLDRHERPNFGHRYWKGFSGLSEGTRNYVLATGNERFQTYSTLNEQKIEAILTDIEHNFSKGRYEYEKNKRLSDAELKKAGRDWIDAGSPMERADFRFHPFQLDALVFGLRRWIEQRIQ